MNYTVNVVCCDRSTWFFSGDDLTGLLTTLLDHMEVEDNFSVGKIVNNYTGSVVHRCEKVVCN